MLADEMVSAADLQAAREVATEQSTAAAVSDFPGSLQAREGRSAGVAAVAVRDEVVPIRTLSPAFVSAVKGARPGRLACLAVPATSCDGRTSSIQTVRGEDGGWTVTNLASGGRESRLAAALPAGATLLHEPQVDAWYAVRGDDLTVLDAGGSGRAAGERLAVAGHRRSVAEAYGDEQSGSGYAAEGTAGGYGPRIGGGDPVLPQLGLGAPAAPGAVAFAVRSPRRT